MFKHGQRAIWAAQQQELERLRKIVATPAISRPSEEFATKAEVAALAEQIETKADAADVQAISKQIAQKPAEELKK